MTNTKCRVIVFASGGTTDCGPNFQDLMITAESGMLPVEIVGVISNIHDGGIKKKTDKAGIRFSYFRGPNTDEGYQQAVASFQADIFIFCDWEYTVLGLDESKIILITEDLGDADGLMSFIDRIEEAAKHLTSIAA